MAVSPVREGTPYDVAQSRRYDAARAREEDPDEESGEAALSEEQRGQLEIARYCLQMLSEAKRAREPYDTFDDNWDVWNGNIWPAKYPSWKSRVYPNKIRAFIWFMTAVMTDQKPRVNVVPRSKLAEKAGKLLGKLVDRDWDEARAQYYIMLAVLYGLIFGTGYLKVIQNPHADAGRGAREWYAPVPYRVYLSPQATGIEDTDYVIHVEDRSLLWIAEHYPHAYERVRKYKGSRVSSTSDSTRDLLREGVGDARMPIEAAVRTATNVIMPDDGRSAHNADDYESVEVAEFWFRDPSEEPYQRQKHVDGVPQMADQIDDDGLPVQEIYGYATQLSPIDGQPYQHPLVRTKRVPVMEWAKRKKYPNHRLAIMAGPCVITDIPNPFQIDGFPFAMWKNQDVGAPLGTGEPIVLKDQNIAIARMISQVFDILEKMGNPSFKYKKGSGLETRSLKNKPGSLIPLDDMEALQQLKVETPSHDQLALVGTLKETMAETSGVHDAFTGQSPGGNTSYAAVDSLQEQSAAPVRLRLRNVEFMIARAGKIDLQLIQQFDKGHRPIREEVRHPWPTEIEGEDGEMVPAPPPAEAVEQQFTEYKNEDLQGPIDFGVVPDSSLSVSPAGIKNLYIKLFELHVIDAQAVLEKFDIDDWREILKRVQQQQALAAAAKGKPGPRPKTNLRAPQRRAAPPNPSGTHADVAAMR